MATYRFIHTGTGRTGRHEPLLLCLSVTVFLIPFYGNPVIAFSISFTFRVIPVPCFPRSVILQKYCVFNPRAGVVVPRNSLIFAITFRAMNRALGSHHDMTAKSQCNQLSIPFTTNMTNVNVCVFVTQSKRKG